MIACPKFRSSEQDQRTKPKVTQASEGTNNKENRLQKKLIKKVKQITENHQKVG